jgi:hypothetical protein
MNIKPPNLVRVALKSCKHDLHTMGVADQGRAAGGNRRAQ